MDGFGRGGRHVGWCGVAGNGCTAGSGGTRCLLRLLRDVEFRSDMQNGVGKNASIERVSFSRQECSDFGGSFASWAGVSRANSATIPSFEKVESEMPLSSASPAFSRTSTAIGVSFGSVLVVTSAGMTSRAGSAQYAELGPK